MATSRLETAFQNLDTTPFDGFMVARLLIPITTVPDGLAYVPYEWDFQVVSGQAYNDFDAGTLATLPTTSSGDCNPGNTPISIYTKNADGAIVFYKAVIIPPESGGLPVELASLVAVEPDSEVAYTNVTNLDPKGVYDAGTAYAVGDTVTYLGSTWWCKQAGTGQTPATASAYWNLLIEGIEPLLTTTTAASSAALGDLFHTVQSGPLIRKVTNAQVFALLDDQAMSWTAAHTFGSTVGVTGNFAVNTNKFNVTASNGNTAIAGDLAINTDKFNVTAASGNAAIAGNLAINTDKFNVTAASGNTAIAGTLAVAGASALAGSMAVSGGAVNLDNATSNWVNFGAVGIGNPTFTTRSAGTKLILYNTIDGSSNGITIGVGAGGTHMTYGCAVATDSFGFKWFGGVTELMRLQGDGKLGIGMTPTRTLDVTGTFGATGAAVFGSTVTLVDATLTRSGANELSTSGAFVIASTGYIGTSLRVGSLSAPVQTLSVTGTFGVSGAAVLGDTLSVAGNASINGGIVTLGNGTSNRLGFGAVGVGDPTFTTRSIGAKIVLYDSIDGSSNGIAIGVGAGGGHMTLNCAEATNSYGFKWFGGITELMRLQGDGKLGLGMSPTNKLDVSGTFGASGAATFGSTVAATGNLTVSGSAITLNHATSNWVNFGAVGVGDPTFTTRSAGTKLILYNTIDGSSNGISIGVGSGGGHMTFGCAEATASYGFKWFAGETNVLTLKGDGQMVFTAPPKLPAYTLGTLPSPSTYAYGMAWCTNHTGGARIVVADGSNWIDPRTGSVAA